MPFKPGHKKFGGKAKGCKNKITQDVVGLLDSLGCNPLEGLARIAENEKHPIEVRTKCLAELAQYLHPKRRAVEISGPSGDPIAINVSPVESLVSRITRLNAAGAITPSSGGNAT